MTTQLTKGLLDGLLLSPTFDDRGQLASLLVTVDTLPGLRIVVDGAAVVEVHAALAAVLSLAVAVINGEPDGSIRRVYISGRDLDALRWLAAFLGPRLANDPDEDKRAALEALITVTT